MVGDLNSFIKRHSKFLKLADGETITVVYMGYVVGADPRNPDVEKVTYKLKPMDYENALFLGSSSVKLARQLKDISVGETIQLTRTGLGKETSYEVTKL